MKQFESLELTNNEQKVYEALLELRDSTKTPIVKTAGVTASKIYDLLNGLIRKGIVTSYKQEGVQHYVPVQAENLTPLFDEKIKELEKEKEQLKSYVEKRLNENTDKEPEVQVFKGWKGMKNAMRILAEDIGEGTYYVLGMTPGENLEKAWIHFPQISKIFDEKNIKRQVILRKEDKKSSDKFIKEHGKGLWKARYYKTPGPVEIGIGKNYSILNIVEENPTTILIKNKKTRDSYKAYFESIWKISE